MYSFSIILFLYAHAVASTPVISLNVCALESIVINGLHAYPSATPFCSTFLGIKTSTITAASTITPSPVAVTSPVTKTAAPVSVTATGSTTITVTSGTAATSTVTVTSTETDATTCASTATTFGGPAIGKRALSPQTSSTTKSSTTTAKNNPTPGPTSSPTIPAALTTFASSALSTACSCLSIPTPSVTTVTPTTLAPVTVVSTAYQTVTPTSTISVTNTFTVTQYTAIPSTAAVVTVTATSTTTFASISPTGLNYYYYQPCGFDYSDDGFSRVPAVVDSLSNNASYQYTSSLQNINAISCTDYCSTINIPGSDNNLPGEDVSIILQGYLYASAGAGIYTISSDKLVIDDTALVWTGATAYGNQWNYDNADYVAEIFGPSGSVSVQLAAGEAYPVTIFYANTYGNAQAEYHITTPDGTVHTDTTGFFIGACEGTTMFNP